VNFGLIFSFVLSLTRVTESTYIVIHMYTRTNCEIVSHVMLLDFLVKATYSYMITLTADSLI
jgi:hypothetical protein